MSLRHPGPSGGAIAFIIVVVFWAVIAAIIKPASGADRCLTPDCSWLNMQNGDLTPTLLPGPHDKPFYWRQGTGLQDWKYQVRKICSRPGNTCNDETKDWLARK